MRQGPRAFSRFSTSDSYIHISCEEKDERAFEPMQCNSAFFRVSISHFLFRIRKHTLGPTHIPIAERILLLRCLWEVGIPLVSKPDNQLSFRAVLGYKELPRIAVLNLVFL